MVAQAYMDAYQVVLVAATAAVIWWTVQYTLSSPWWRDEVGRTFVLKDIALLGLLVPSCLLVPFPQLLTPFEAVTIGVCVLGGIFIIMAWRSVTWWKIQRPRPVRMIRSLRKPRTGRQP